jgi:hypothetical protein
LRTAGGGSAVAARGRHSVVSTPIATTSDAIFYLVASGGESKASRTGGDNPAIA